MKMSTGKVIEVKDIPEHDADLYRRVKDYRKEEIQVGDAVIVNGASFKVHYTNTGQGRLTLTSVGARLKKSEYDATYVVKKLGHKLNLKGRPLDQGDFCELVETLNESFDQQYTNNEK